MSSVIWRFKLRAIFLARGVNAPLSTSSLLPVLLGDSSWDQSISLILCPVRTRSSSFSFDSSFCFLFSSSSFSSFSRINYSNSWSTSLTAYRFWDYPSFCFLGAVYMHHVAQLITKSLHDRFLHLALKFTGSFSMNVLIQILEWFVLMSVSCAVCVVFLYALKQQMLHVVTEFKTA